MGLGGVFFLAPDFVDEAHSGDDLFQVQLGGAARARQILLAEVHEPAVEGFTHQLGGTASVVLQLLAQFDERLQCLDADADPGQVGNPDAFQRFVDAALEILDGHSHALQHAHFDAGAVVMVGDLGFVVVLLSVDVFELGADLLVDGLELGVVELRFVGNLRRHVHDAGPRQHPEPVLRFLDGTGHRPQALLQWLVVGAELTRICDQLCAAARGTRAVFKLWETAHRVVELLPGGLDGVLQVVQRAECLGDFFLLCQQLPQVLLGVFQLDVVFILLRTERLLFHQPVLHIVLDAGQALQQGDFAP